MPLEATQHTSEGAKSFAEFFIKTIDWGYATTSSTYMRHYFTTACIGCRSTADAIDKAAKQHHHFIGDRFTALAANAAAISSSSSVANARFDVTSGEVVTKSGKYVAAEPALSRVRQRLLLEWHGDGWTVVDFLAQN